MIGKAQGPPISITGVGAYVPDRVLTNAELSTLVDTSDEWIMERTGIRERRIAAPEQALTDLALPAAQAALAQAGVEGKDIDLLLCATVTPDMMFPTSSALLADTLGARDAAAYDLLAGCTGFKYATRVLVSSAEAVLQRCGVSVEDVDVYIPHQANVRILDHAVKKLGIPRERMIVNVDRYGNTSSGSIPLALADAQREGRLKKGDLVLMTGMGAGLTWGSGLMEWSL